MSDKKMSGALVLSRKVGQTICIGDTIEVKVLRIEGAEVKLVIVADGVQVDRLEVRQAKGGAFGVMERYGKNF